MQRGLGPNEVPSIEFLPPDAPSSRLESRSAKTRSGTLLAVATPISGVEKREHIKKGLTSRL
jgi:hypothetical protein